MIRQAGKPILLALLALDTAYYAIAGTPSKAIDAAAWLVLLVLFDVETLLARRGAGQRVRRLLRAVRLFAAGGVIAATFGYVVDDDRLDAVNSALWIGVVILLEVEFRRPALVARARGMFASVAFLLYGGLAVLVLVWASHGEWFDAYDAALWLVAFAMLELDAVRAEGRA